LCEPEWTLDSWSVFEIRIHCMTSWHTHDAWNFHLRYLQETGNNTIATHTLKRTKSHLWTSNILFLNLLNQHDTVLRPSAYNTAVLQNHKIMDWHTDMLTCWHAQLQSAVKSPCTGQYNISSASADNCAKRQDKRWYLLCSNIISVQHTSPYIFYWPSSNNIKTDKQSILLFSYPFLLQIYSG
jgi:hypothetical protein